MKQSLSTLVLLCILHTISAQPSEYELLKEFNGKEIRMLSESDELTFYAIKNRKRGKWGIVYTVQSTDEEYESVEVVKPKFDTIGDFESADFTLVEQDGKWGILYQPTASNYSQVVNVDFNYSDAMIRNDFGIASLVVKSGGKWGQIDPYEKFDISGFLFATAFDVPLTSVDSWSASHMATARRKLGADIIEMDFGNGDGVFKSRHANSKLWGMYQSLSENELTELIPMEFDSLHFFSWNGFFTPVYQSGKVGFYLSKWSYNEQAKQSVPCLYDDYQRFSADGVSKLACKRDGKWGWVNWLTGEEESEFYAETSDDLQYPYYHQATWFE